MVARVYGYDRLAVAETSVTLHPVRSLNRRGIDREVREQLALRAGLQEVITCSPPPASARSRPSCSTAHPPPDRNVVDLSCDDEADAVWADPSARLGLRAGDAGSARSRC